MRLEVLGNAFYGDATKCFDGKTNVNENMKLAEVYWNNDQSQGAVNEVAEILVDGEITVKDIVKEINANI